MELVACPDLSLRGDVVAVAISVTPLLRYSDTPLHNSVLCYLVLVPICHFGLLYRKIVDPAKRENLFVKDRSYRAFWETGLFRDSV